VADAWHGNRGVSLRGPVDGGLSSVGTRRSPGSSRTVEVILLREMVSYHGLHVNGKSDYKTTHAPKAREAPDRPQKIKSNLTSTKAVPR